MSDEAARKRSCFRFSLKTLLVVFVVLGFGLGWLALEMRRAERQRKAVEAIRAAGGDVYYDYRLDESGSPAPAWLRELIGEDFFSDVADVGFGIPNEIDDVILEHIKTLTKLERLWLNGKRVTDVRLEHLDGLANLEWLDLSDTQVTDAGLEHLKGLPHLEWLDLSGTQVTEEGIEKLQKILPDCEIHSDYSPDYQP